VNAFYLMVKEAAQGQFFELHDFFTEVKMNSHLPG